MDQRQFEQAILQMIHARRVERLTPSAVAYEFGMSVKDAEKALDRMVTGETLELDSDDDGNLFYFLPGLGAAGVFMQGTAAANPSEPPTPPNASPNPYQGGPNAQQPPSSGAPWTPPPSAPPYGAPQGPPPGSGMPGHNPYATGGAQGGAPYGQAPPSYGQNPYGQPQGGPGYGQPPASQGGYGNAGPYGNAGYGQAPNSPPQGYPSNQGGAGYGGNGGYAPTQSGYPPQQYPQPNYGNAYAAPNANHPNYNPPSYAYGHQAMVPVSTAPRSAAAASLLSAMFPGAGQLYNGQVGKGLFFFFSTVVMLNFGPLAMLPWLWGVVDAYSTTRRTNTQAYGLLPHQP